MYDLVVLGGGSGGLNVSTAAARVGAKVALIEKHKLGGECTHTACVPSKALIKAARLAQEIREAPTYGLRVEPPQVDFPAVAQRVRSVVADFAGSGSGESLRARGIDVFFGTPRFEAYDTVVLDGRDRLQAHRFVIATGSRPEIPDLPGLAEAGYFDNTTIWDLNAQPESLLVIGAGPVGLELGQAFARLGTKVTILNDQPHILPQEDPEVADRVQHWLAEEGITFFNNVEITGIEVRDGQKVCTFHSKDDGAPFQAARSAILNATGRLANIEGLNLEAVGIHADPRRGIPVDEYLQTDNPRILAIGDVIGHHQWTHAAEREASVAFQNAVLRLPKKIDYTAVPWATFLDPEVATVGLTEPQAREQHTDDGVRVFRIAFDDLDRPRIDGRTRGFAKLVANPSGKILGASIVGDNASLVLQEFVLAMEHGLSLGDLANTVHTYPTHAGLARKLANQYAATRLERGFVRTALRWFLGYEPRPENGASSPEPQTAEQTPAKP